MARNRTVAASSAFLRSVPADDLATARQRESQRVAIQAKAAAVVDLAGSKAAAARLLDVARTQPGAWMSGAETPSEDSWQRLVDLEYVMSRVALVWHPAMVMDWLHSSNAFLDGARPVDVLRTVGPHDVLAAINAEAAGSFA